MRHAGGRVPEVLNARVLALVASAIDSALVLSFVLAATAAPGATPETPLGPRTDITSAPTEVPGAGLAITPPSFWMRTGENFTLRAVWWSDSALCPASALWFVWSVDEGVATGFLNATTGPSVVFTAYSLESGPVVVDVRSAADLECPSNATLVERTNSTEVSIVTPLDLSDVQASPMLLSPEGVVSLDGNVTGGAPPYSVDVAWGDGTRTSFDLSGPGAFSVNHTFAVGEFVPYVVVSDSESDIENRSVPEAISVGSGFRVSVVPSTFVAEVGVPVDLAGVALDAPGGSIALFDCTNASIDSTARASSASNATDFACTFESAGTQEVLFGLYPSEIGGASASAVLYETVVPPPSLTVVPVASVGEVGRAALLEVSLSGGAMPISLSWNLTGNRSAGSEIVDADGSEVLGLPLAAPGDYALGIRAIDRFGVTEANSTLALEVESPLGVDTVASRSAGSGGEVAQILGQVLAGCPPFSWWVVPQFPAANESPPSGLLAAEGEFPWNGSYAREGTGTFSVVVVDACGATWRATLEEELVAPLNVDIQAAAVSSSANDTLALIVSIQDGWPPYRLFVNSTDNQSWNRTVPSPGTYRFEWATAANGSISIIATLVDGLGASYEFQLNVSWPASAPPPPAPAPTPSPPNTTGDPSPDSGPGTLDVLGLLASFAAPAIIGTGLALLWRRRVRKRKSEIPEPEAEAVLKDILQGADGAERFTVELLAEQRGVPLEKVRATIHRLIANGRIRTESGADGEEVLSWSGSGGR